MARIQLLASALAVCLFVGAFAQSPAPVASPAATTTASPAPVYGSPVDIDGKTWPACSADYPVTQITIDSLGRPWGWENAKSCIATVGAAATVTIDGKAYPRCLVPAAAGAPDAQGRRWGWENGKSCVVILDAAAPAPAAADSATVDGKAYPICKDAASAAAPDQYGRRWGWENKASCVIVSAVPANAVMIDGKAYAVCKDGAATTPDGWGRRWGFENGASCVIVGTATVQIDGKTWNRCADVAKAGSADKYGRRWGFENGMSCVVLP